MPHRPEHPINRWVSTFVAAAVVAVEQSEKLVGQITELRAEWHGPRATRRESLGLRPRSRADSAVVRLLDQLTEAPVVTASTLARILSVWSVARGRTPLERCWT
jgi:hypothetical protein